MHLTVRAINALHRAEVHSIGSLINRARLGIWQLPGAGKHSINEILAALRALPESIQLDGRIDWIEYARERRFPLLPAGRTRAKALATEFVERFPTAVGTAVKSRFGAAAKGVFCEYLLGAPIGLRALSRIGQEMDRTKQAISLHKKKILALLKATMLADDYAGCRFRFRAEFVAPLRRLAEALAGQDKVLSYSRWAAILGNAWQLAPSELGDLESLILELLGYEIRHRSGRRHEPIVAATMRSTLKLTAALAMTERLLRINFPAGVSIKELTQALDARGQPKMDSRKLREFVKTIPGVEEKGGIFRFRIEKLSRATDQLERILEERGRPMMAIELAQELTKLCGKMDLQQTPLHLRNDMSSDRRKRFKSIGRTGLWTLKAWNLETANVADVVARVMRDSARPMTEAELYPLIVARRPVKLDSIGSMLRESGNFRRIAPRTWELKH